MISSTFMSLPTLHNQLSLLNMMEILPGSWSCFHPWVECAYSTTQLTPFQYILGYQPPLLPWNSKLIGAESVAEWFQSSEEAHWQLSQAIQWQK